MGNKRGRFADARAVRLARNGRTLLTISSVAAVFTGASVAGSGGVTAVAGQMSVVVASLGALAVVCYMLAVSAERAAETAWRVAELKRRGVQVVVARRPERVASRLAADLAERARLRRLDEELIAFERAEAEASRLAAFEREEWLESLRLTKRDAQVVHVSGYRPRAPDPRPRRSSD
jgi:hypothetical protein